MKMGSAFLIQEQRYFPLWNVSLFVSNSFESSFYNTPLQAASEKCHARYIPMPLFTH